MRPLIAGNWKMNTDLNQGVDLVLKLRELVKGHTPPEPSSRGQPHRPLCTGHLLGEKRGLYRRGLRGDARLCRVQVCDYRTLRAPPVLRGDRRDSKQKGHGGPEARLAAPRVRWAGP